MVKREQDVAYAESLEADKQKELAKQQEKEMEEMRDAHLKAMKEKEEHDKQQQEALKEVNISYVVLIWLPILNLKLIFLRRQLGCLWLNNYLMNLQKIAQNL